MKSFRCEICNDPFPMSLHHLHHKIPKALGGSDDPTNLVNLCQTDHQLLHTIAYMLINPKRNHEVEPTLASVYGGEQNVKKKVLEYAGYAAKEMALKKEIIKDPDSESRVVVELPQLYLQLLKLAAYDLPRQGNKPTGTGSLIRILVAEFLSRKFPQKREQIMRLRKPLKK